jgi:hypothetical protein
MARSDPFDRADVEPGQDEETIVATTIKEVSRTRDWIPAMCRVAGRRCGA